MSLIRHVVAHVLSQRGMITPAEVYASLTRKGVAEPLRRYSSTGKAKQAVRVCLVKAKRRGLIFSPVQGFYRKS